MEHRKSWNIAKWKCSQVSKKNPSKTANQLALTEKNVFGIDKVNRDVIKQQSVKQEKIEQKNEEEEIQKPHKEQAVRLKLSPKPQSLKVVSSSFREKLCEHRFNDPSSITACSLDYSSEFPALNEKHTKKNIDIPDDSHSTNILQVVVNRKKKELMIDKGLRNCTSNQNTDNQRDRTKSTKKVPRTERPITFDLLEANESCKIKKLQSKSISKKSKRLLKHRDQSTRYGGNILDSDQPFRHKGKIRLGQKKRVTKVKTVILERRQVWKTKKTEWKSAFDGSQKIKLTTDMIKDALVLKSFSLPMHERKELSSSRIVHGHSDKEDKILSDKVESEPQAHDSFLATNDSIIKELGKNLGFHEDSPSCLDDNLNVIDNQVLTPKRMIHSRRFAIYCDQWPIKELTDAVNELLKKLGCFQQKTQVYDPVKLYSKRRFNLGLTEVTKYLKLGKIVMVIFATDIEEIDGKGGLLDTISNIRKMANLQKVPYVFANTQKKLKGILKKNAHISCIGIRNYEGADKQFKTILELLPEAKRLYKEKLEDAEIMCGVKSEESEMDPNVAVVQSLLSKLTSSLTEKNDIYPVGNSGKDTVDACPFLSAIKKHEETKN